MSKSLKTVQTIAYVLKILTKIGFVVSLVCAVLSLICIPALIITDGSSLFIIVADYLPAESGNALNAALSATICAFTLCVTSTVLEYDAYSYFKKELNDGTPFTASGAKDLRRLGILCMVLSAVCLIVCEIVAACFGEKVIEIGLGEDFTVGLVLILLSFVFAYGYELKEKCAKTEQNDAEKAKETPSEF